ncbi:MAG TPA: N-acetylglucosamine-6-phosphate deacetylase [Blastocatellia bacterium]|nr:N-acetylglucosamine-6-phosphate deacetylase [Blastocatellia bacterium]
MDQLLLHNATVVLEDGIQNGGVLIRDNRIAGVFVHSQMPAGISSRESIDLREAYLAPGLIDIHIHGSAGVDVQNTDADGFSRLSEFLLREGVTGYFPTFVPTDEGSYKAAISNVEARAADRQPSAPGAQILGIHFEGPFVSHNKCGALEPKHFRAYDGDPGSIGLFTGTGLPRLMTLAPEIGGGIDLTRELSRLGVRVFIGHTQADPETLDLAFKAGARHITHFPNALDQLHHRRPGAVAWGLLHPEVTIDCIADFHHVDPLMLRLIYQSKTPNRMALISDAIQPAGLGNGEFTVWGARIAVRDGSTALVDGPAAGALAGSVITLREALKNVVSLGVPLHEAIKMASLQPLRVAGLDRENGSIQAGKHADMIALGGNFDIEMVIARGEVIVR